MQGEQATDRTVLRISGADHAKFLKGLVTCDAPAETGELRYSALLTPQGKYLADFFLFTQEEAIYLDIKSELAASLAQRLNMYKLRADVLIEATDLKVQRGLGAAPDGAMPDPRSTALGWRSYGDDAGTTPSINWDEIRVANCVPETGVELIANDTFILEVGFERLSGVDFKKGCYVGQEVTARMKHKTELRKGLAVVEIDGTAEIGGDIIGNGKTVGQIFTQSNGKAIAYLRFDRASENMESGDATVHFTSPAK